MSANCRFLGAIVFYNPDKNAFKNLNNLCIRKELDKVIVFDNSEKEQYEINLEFPNIEYVNFKKNLGIAYALKYIMQYAIDNDYDFVLTMDQDSCLPDDSFSEAIQIVKKYKQSNIGIISLNYNNKYKSKNKKDIKYLKKIITSGNFINVDLYKKIDGFKEELFIDYVDFDLCNQFYKKAIKIAVIPKISISHTIGNPIFKHFIFLKIKCLNHSPLRYYYRYRNALYCYNNDRRFYFIQHFKEFLQYIFMLCFENDREEKKKMVKIGKKDARKNILGPFKQRLEDEN